MNSQMRWFKNVQYEFPDEFPDERWFKNVQHEFPDEWMFYENLLFLFIFEEKIKVYTFTNFSVFAHFQLFWTYWKMVVPRIRLQKYHDQDWWDSKSAAWTPETVKYPLVEPTVCWHGNEPVQAHIQCLLNEFVNETVTTLTRQHRFPFLLDFQKALHTSDGEVPSRGTYCMLAMVLSKPTYVSIEWVCIAGRHTEGECKAVTAEYWKIFIKPCHTLSLLRIKIEMHSTLEPGSREN